MPDNRLVASQLRREKQEDAAAAKASAAESRAARDASREAAAAERERQSEIKRTADAYERLAQKMRSMQGSEAKITGPYQRAERLREELARADSRGIGVAGQGDIRIALAAAEAQIKKFEEGQRQPSFAERFGDFIGNSRFQLGPLQPMVGKAAALFGGGGNPYAMAAQLVMDGGKEVAQALVNVAEDAAEAGRRFSEIRTVTGAGTENAARLRAYGIDPGSTRAMQDRITSDPFARMYAGRVGVNPVGGPFGTLDTAKTTLDLVRGLRTLEGDEQARAIRALGAEHLAPLLRVSQRTLNRLEKDAELSARFYDKSLEMRTAEYDVAKQRFAQSGEDLGTVLGQRPMEFFTRYLNYHTELNKVLAEEFDKLQKAEDMIFKWLEPIIYPLGNPFEGLGGGEAANVPLDDNTRALNATTAELVKLNKTFGGGERSDRALPGSLYGPRGRADAVVRNYEQGALRLGGL